MGKWSYSFIGVGFCVARSTISGNARALVRRTSNGIGLLRLFFYKVSIRFNRLVGESAGKRGIPFCCVGIDGSCKGKSVYSFSS